MRRHIPTWTTLTGGQVRPLFVRQAARDAAALGAREIPPVPSSGHGIGGKQCRTMDDKAARGREGHDPISFSGR